MNMNILTLGSIGIFLREINRYSRHYIVLIHLMPYFSNQLIDQWNNGKLADKRNTNGDLNMLRLYRKRRIPFIKKWKIMSGGDGESNNDIRLYKRKNVGSLGLRVHDKKDVRLY